MSDRKREPEAVDLSALGDRVSRARLDEMVAATIRRSENELQRRRSGAGIVRVVVAWRRPVLVMAGLAAAAAIALTVLAAPGVSSDLTGTVRSSSIAESLGIPAGYAAAVEGSSRDGAMP